MKKFRKNWIFYNIYSSCYFMNKIRINLFPIGTLKLHLCFYISYKSENEFTSLGHSCEESYWMNSHRSYTIGIKVMDQSDHVTQLYIKLYMLLYNVEKNSKIYRQLQLTVKFFAKFSFYRNFVTWSGCSMALKNHFQLLWIKVS